MTAARRGLAWLTAALIAVPGLQLAQAQSKKPGAKPPSALSTLAERLPPADPNSLSGVYQRLCRVPAGQLTDSQRVARVALAAVLSLGLPDGEALAETIDVTGYQSLPIEGSLPDPPPRPIRPSDLATYAAGRKRDMAILNAPGREVVLLTPEELKARSPAMAEWANPLDHAVLITAPQPLRPGWVQRDAVLLVRIRGTRATIVGGSLLSALDAKIQLG